MIKEFKSVYNQRIIWIVLNVKMDLLYILLILIIDVRVNNIVLILQHVLNVNIHNIEHFQVKYVYLIVLITVLLLIIWVIVLSVN
jgi:hypothetical protein